jgi:protein SCO1/2
MRGAAALIAVAFVLFACHDAETIEKPLSEPGEKVYTLKGKILSRDADDNTLRIDHDAIAGYMEAMTMDYSVRGAKVGVLPASGTRIEARLHVTSNGYWLTDVQKAH